MTTPAEQGSFYASPKFLAERTPRFPAFGFRYGRKPPYSTRERRQNGCRAEGTSHSGKPIRPAYGKLLRPQPVPAQARWLSPSKPRADFLGRSPFDRLSPTSTSSCASPLVEPVETEGGFSGPQPIRPAYGKLLRPQPVPAQARWLSPSKPRADFLGRRPFERVFPLCEKSPNFAPLNEAEGRRLYPNLMLILHFHDGFKPDTRPHRQLRIFWKLRM